MNTTWQTVTCVLLMASLALGADSHGERVARAKAEFTAKREKTLRSIAELEVSLEAHGVVSKDVAAARETLDEMMKSRAWRDLASRTTKTQREARVTLEQFLKTAREQTAAPRQQLALIKKAEFEAWARANPEAAKLLEIQRRAEAAESAAMNAQWQAQEAEAAAARAQADAEQAQWQAQEAERRAREAERRARNAQQRSQQAAGLWCW